MQKLTLDQKSHKLDLGPKDKSFFDIVPGYWMWRQDPTIEALVHNHDTGPAIAYLFCLGIFTYTSYTYFGRLKMHASRPLFVINKKTWFNTKVPRQRARIYDRRFRKPPDDVKGDVILPKGRQM